MSDNDFTLAQLQELSCRIESWIQFCGDKDELELVKILEEMIENYCDHDFQHTYNEREEWYCKHCGIT